MTFFLMAVGVLFLSAIPGVLTRKGSLLWERCSLVLSITGCALGISSTIFILLHPEQAVFIARWHLVPGAAIAFKLDALSAVFLFPAFLVTAAGSLYATGYWPVREKAASGAWLRFFYPILSGSIMLLLCSNNAFLFLVNWEIMALTGYFLVVTERNKEEAHKAGFIYLAATHTGTLALFGSFALLMHMAPGIYLPAVSSLDGHGWPAGAVFLLALFGFGLKAGLIPLHIWLPGAHANAPSNVSALMSGVIIKMGIYGLMRLTSFFEVPPLWWGQTILALGLVSAIFGVVLAIAQHDIKRLLAYHSVENIGIILLGFGVALIGRSYHNNSMTVLGLAGALLHVINHGLFKGLLFLSAGSIIHKTGTRTMMHYGGLLKSMPYTGFFFLGGAVAICGLPPLNGFVSEWMVYLGIFSTIQGNMPLIGILAAPALAMTGGLALLCFAKVFGLSFLGEPRTTLHVTNDSPRSMLWAMGLLFFCCLWIGVAPATLVPFLQKSVEAWTGSVVANPLHALVSAGHISLVSLSLLLVVVILVVVLQRKSARQQIKKQPTWGCGYGHTIARIQYTTSSFAQTIDDFFGWVLQTDKSCEKPVGIFPVNRAFCKTHTPDVFLDHLIQPLFSKTEAFAVRIRRLVQNGIIGYYLLYSVFATCLLLMLMHF
jgi:hydrogenase-4 component B